MSFFFLLLAASLLSSWWLISKAFLTGTFVLGMLQLLVQSGYGHVFLTPEKFSFLANSQCDAADLSFQTLPKRVPRAPRTSRLLSSFFIFPKILMTPKKEPTSCCLSEHRGGYVLVSCILPESLYLHMSLTNLTIWIYTFSKFLFAPAFEISWIPITKLSY